jgi:uncharacterized protein
VLRYNVAGLLKAAPGEIRTYPVTGELIEIADDLSLAAPIEGELRLSKTSRSVLVHADLSTQLVLRCSRCLVEMTAPVDVTVDEEALPSVDFETGKPLDIDDEPEALRIDEHHELDLHETIREAISLAEPIAPLCREDCRGLCVTCGTDLNADPAHHHEDDAIDPRLAALAAWRDDADATPGPPDRTH